MANEFPVGRSRSRRRRQYLWTLSDLRQKHMLVCGQSGAGKTTWLAQLVNWLVDQGAAVFVFDFKGDLVRLNSRHVTRRYFGKKTVFFDPGRAMPLDGRVANLNVFDGPYLAATKAAHFKTAVKTLFRAPGHASVLTSNPWLDEMLLLIGNLLASAPSPHGAWTIFDALPALSPTDTTFRDYLLDHAANPFLQRRFSELDEYRLSDRCAMANPVLARLQQLLLLRPVAAIHGGPRTTISFERMLERAGVFLGLFEHPQIDASEMAFIAATALLKLKEAIFSRKPRDYQRPCFVVIDECQTLVDAGLGDTLALLLEKSRSFGCHLILSSQFLTQYVPQDSPHNTRLLESVISQTAIKVAFRTSRTDAEVLKLWAEFFADLFEKETHRIKHQVLSTMLKPVLTFLNVHSRGTSSSQGGSRGTTEGDSYSSGGSEGRSEEESFNDVTASGEGTTHLHSKGHGYSEGESSSDSSMDGWGHSDITSSGSFDSQSFPADAVGMGGTIGLGSSNMSGFTDNSFYGSGTSNGRSSARTDSESEGTAESEQFSEAHGHSQGESFSSQENWSAGHSTSKSKQKNWTEGDSHNLTRSPFYLYREEKEEAGRTYYGPEEVREDFINRLTQQERREFVVKDGIRPALEQASWDLRPDRVSTSEVERMRRKNEIPYTNPTAEVLLSMETRVPKYIEGERARVDEEVLRRALEAQGKKPGETPLESGDGIDPKAIRRVLRPE